MAAMLLIWSILASKSSPSATYPDGAAESACDTMTPFHRFDIQTTPPPFVVSLSADSYGPNEKINVTLLAPCGMARFKGFLLQARVVNDPTNDIRRAGSFNSPVGSHYVKNCGSKGQAVTHDINNLKTTMQFEWTAPPEPSGHIVMTATFVQNINVFWVKVNSYIVRDRSLMFFPESTDGTSYPTPSKDCFAVEKKFVRENECGPEQNCFARCDSSACDVAITWTVLPDTHEVIFNMAAVVDKRENQAIFLAFSDDKVLSNDSVVACISFERDVVVYSFEMPEELERLENTTQESGAFVKVNGSFEDEVFSCSFRRSVASWNTSWIRSGWYLIFFRELTGNETNSNRTEVLDSFMSGNKVRFYVEDQTTFSTKSTSSMVITTLKSSAATICPQYVIMFWTLLVAIRTPRDNSPSRQVYYSVL